MAKRFTDTGKWGKASFDRLSLVGKLAWIYLCDNCDHAGIWDVNWRLMSFHLNLPAADLERVIAEELSDKVDWLADTKIFIPGFIEFQYGELNPENRAHLSVLNRLRKEGANKGLTRSLQGRKDKDKDKDKDTDKDSLEGVQGKPFRPDLAAVYARYPRKKGKTPGLKKLASTIKSLSDEQDAHRALDAFIAHHKREGTAAEFIPHFSTWASSWRDWLDPDHGQGESFSAKAPSIADIELPDYGKAGA